MKLQGYWPVVSFLLLHLLGLDIRVILASQKDFETAPSGFGSYLFFVILNSLRMICCIFSLNVWENFVVNPRLSYLEVFLLLFQSVPRYGSV